MLGIEIATPVFPGGSRALFRPRDEECLALAQRLAPYGMKRAPLGQAHPACQRRQAVPGLGPAAATALIAAIGEATQVKDGRQPAAWLG